MCSRPSSGSSARISTAAPTSGGSQTALSSAWIPYERYTYARPGGPNRVAVRAVRPTYAWQAGSESWYASVSTITPAVSPCRTTHPSRSRATSTTGRS